MTRRTYIRMVSFITFGLVILFVTALSSTKDATTYKNQLELNYQQSLTELAECLDSVNTDLTKSLYSNSSGEIYDLSRDLYAQCSTAKNAISRLPVSQMELSNTYKFLSQAGDYAQFIGQKIDRGEAISDKEHKNLSVLLDYAQKFSNAANDMVRIVENGGKITEGNVANNSEINVSLISNSFSNSAKTFDDFPTLIYDGPFSDQILNKESLIVKNSKVKTKAECKSIVAKVLGTSEKRISFETDEQSKIPCYVYKCGRYTVSVTKQGGYIKSILYSGLINESQITNENAINIATDYLSNIGYNNMRECYYSTSGNICTICFAYCENDVLYYGDLIKCGVSMSDGNIVTLDATTYLTNHRPRDEFTSSITAEEAMAYLSPYLTVNNTKKCVIPKESEIEAQCYEFTCTGKDTGEDALIYINCKTGREEDIMLMLNTDNGTLVK